MRRYQQFRVAARGLVVLSPLAAHLFQALTNLQGLENPASTFSLALRRIWNQIYQVKKSRSPGTLFHAC